LRRPCGHKKKQLVARDKSFDNDGKWRDSFQGCESLKSENRSIAGPDHILVAESVDFIDVFLIGALGI